MHTITSTSFFLFFLYFCSVTEGQEITTLLDVPSINTEPTIPDPEPSTIIPGRHQSPLPSMIKGVIETLHATSHMDIPYDRFLPNAISYVKRILSSVNKDTQPESQRPQDTDEKPDYTTTTTGKPIIEPTTISNPSNN